MNIPKEKFAAIIRENERKLQHLCRSYVSHREDQKDLYQEIILQAWRSLPSFDGKAKLSTWIYRIGINTAVSYLRKKETRQNYHKAYKKEKERETPGGEEEFPVYADGEEQQVSELYDAIATLNASEKAIITMYLEEFSYQEIAYAMDITENYVGVKLNRIKKKLSNRMEN